MVSDVPAGDGENYILFFQCTYNIQGHKENIEKYEDDKRFGTKKKRVITNDLCELSKIH